eukprot:3575040-Amphidinium_carterae.1
MLKCEFDFGSSLPTRKDLCGCTDGGAAFALRQADGTSLGQGRMAGCWLHYCLHGVNMVCNQLSATLPAGAQRAISFALHVFSWKSLAWSSSSLLLSGFAVVMGGSEERCDYVSLLRRDARAAQRADLSTACVCAILTTCLRKKGSEKYEEALKKTIEDASGVKACGTSVVNSNPRRGAAPIKWMPMSVQSVLMFKA